MIIYIYSLNDPITDDIRYVGKTGNLKNRLQNHISTKTNRYTANWINSLSKRGLLPIINIIEVCNETNWEERERFWIAYYRSITKLCNIQEGGNQPAPKKVAIQKYTKKGDKFIAKRSYNNTVYYLGSYTTAEEAISAYDLFDVKSIKHTYNVSGVNVYKDGEMIMSFDTISECADFIKGFTPHISACCRGKKKQYRGYTFKYKYPA